VECSRAIPLAVGSFSTGEVAYRLKTRLIPVSEGRQRFGQHHLGGLSNAARTDKQTTRYQQTEKRILAVLDGDPELAHSRWSGRLLADALDSVSDDQVWRVLREHKIKLQRRRSWCISTDPKFGPRTADVVGVYLSPSKDAVVMCVDEKPRIQVLDSVQGWLRLPGGIALSGRSHRYRRHGTFPPFASLKVSPGQVQERHYPNWGCRESLDFMNDVAPPHTGQEIHVILGNLNAHKPKPDRWLARHPNVRFHLLPTSSSSLSMAEVWFRILSPWALGNFGCTAVRQFREAIDRYVRPYRETSARFEWQKTVVEPSSDRTLL